MSEINNINQDELTFEEKLSTNFDGVLSDTSAKAERLKDVNKKLPKWNLEPPMNFIK